MAKVNPRAGLLDLNPLPSCNPGELTSWPSVFSSKVTDNNDTFLTGLVQGLNELINANQLKLCLAQSKSLVTFLIRVTTIWFFKQKKEMVLRVCFNSLDEEKNMLLWISPFYGFSWDFKTLIKIPTNFKGFN